MYKNLYDSHIHSDNSHDGHDSVEAICRKAIEMGFAGLAITDHAECQGYLDLVYQPRLLKSVADAAAAAEQFKGQLTVIRGFELGQPLQDTALALELLELCDYDFVIGSLHGLGGKTKEDFEYWAFMEDPNHNGHEKLVDYYNQLIDLAHWGNFDVMGHITYPVRHVKMDFDRYMEQIDQLMRILIADGRGIEINTSGLRQGVGMTMPHLELVKHYRQLGGEIITLGSDAHYLDHVGHSIDIGMDMLAAAGFKYVTYYQNRKPYFVPVE